LVEVRTMIESGQIRVVPVGDLLGFGPAAYKEAREDHRSSAPAQAAEVDAAARAAVYELYDEIEIYEHLEELLGSAKGNVWVWSPYVARRAEEVLPHLERHAAAGRPVMLFVKPPNERHGCPEEMLHRFRRAGVRAIGIYLMHQKLVILDDRRTLVGSLNLLSHARRRPTTELMVLVEGERFAKELLRQQLAEQLRRCPRCGDHPDVWCYADREKRTASNPRWVWRCPAAGCDRTSPMR
jgi:phosphatidylserine/phosphatidylglycerophosphate/cardiolipin synthase-like enzyme